MLGILTVESSFSAAHRLLGYKGDCSNLHGHNYKVRVAICYTVLKDSGMAVDFKSVKEEIKNCLKHYDHRVVLNSDDPLVSVLVAEGEPVVCMIKLNPTAEAMSMMIFKHLEKTFSNKYGLRVDSVEVEETAGCSAKYIG